MEQVGGKTGNREEKGEGETGKENVCIPQSPLLSLLSANANQFLCGNNANQFYYSIKHLRSTQSIF